MKRWLVVAGVLLGGCTTPVSSEGDSGCAAAACGSLDAGISDAAGAAADAAVTPDAAQARDASTTPDASVPPDAAVTPDAAITPDAAVTPDAAASTPDAGPPPACVTPSGLGRAATWVRANPMFISGLSVGLGAPNAAAVTDYFDLFHASAVHLWENGMPAEIVGWSDATNPRAWVSWTHFDGTSVANAQVLGGIPPPPGRIGYQVGDEPLDMGQLLAMYGGVTAVRAADPDALIILNFADIDALDTLLASAQQNADVDVFSYDRYNYSRDHYKVIGKVREAALNSGKQYWRYLDAYRDISDTGDTSLSDFRWDVFIGAAYGYTGHSWFLYQIDGSNQDLVPLLFDVKGDYASTKTEKYAAVALLNQQLAHLGRTLSLLRSVDVRYFTALALTRPEGTTGWTRGAGGDPYLANIGNVPANTWRDAVVGTFKDDCEERYTVLQSVAHTQANFPNASDADTTFRLEFDFSAATDVTLDRTAIVVLRPEGGEPAAVALTPQTANTASVELTLPAGGALLFKYKNARPMVRQ